MQQSFIHSLAVREEGCVFQGLEWLNTGQSIKNIQLFSGKVDDDDRFALISTGHQVWKYVFEVENVTEVIVKTDLFTVNYQATVLRRMQNKVYLVVDQMVMAKFNAASFPDKRRCFRFSGKFKFQRYANLKAMEAPQRTTGSLRTSPPTWRSPMTILL